MRKGFVFGKFLPFHLGHRSMIQFALTQCDSLSILICCSNTETINGEIRRAWISSSFPNEKKLDLIIFNYDESELPNSSVSSREVSSQWAKVFKKLFPEHQVLITSEPYGDFLAEFMDIEHISFDTQRTGTPISSSQVRKDILSAWKYLPFEVKLFYTLKIIILGTESTGKTTLSKHLAEHFKCACVEEVGRDLISDSKCFSLDDLYVVAIEHAKRINENIEKNPLLIIDTDIHITKSYGSFKFGEELIVPRELYQTNKGNLYLYLTCDVPHVQDGTRLSEQDRKQLDNCHRGILKSHGIEYVEIGGDWNSRFDQAVKLIQKLIHSKSL